MITQSQNDESYNKLVQQLNYIQRKINERTALSNISNFAIISEKLSKGNVNVSIDSVNKIITFSNCFSN